MDFLWVFEAEFIDTTSSYLVNIRSETVVVRSLGPGNRRQRVLTTFHTLVFLIVNEISFLVQWVRS